MDEVREWLSTPTEVLAQRPRTDQDRARLVEEFKRDHPEKYQEHLRRRAEARARVTATLPPSFLTNACEKSHLLQGIGMRTGQPQ